MPSFDRSRSGWVRSALLFPAAVLPLLPSATCPACIAAYAGVASALGLGFLFDEHYLAPLIVGFLAVGVGSVAWTTRAHRRAGPLATAVIGGAAVIAGRLVWRLPPLVYAGAALLVVGSLWNLWLKRRRPVPLVHLGRAHVSTRTLAEAQLVVPEMHCEGCASRIGGVLRGLAGVREVVAHVREKRVVVRFDPAQLDRARIVDALASLGFAVPAKGS